MQELSELAAEQECAFLEKWKQIPLETGKVSRVFQKNWERKNREFMKG